MRWSVIPLGISSGKPTRERHVSATALVSEERWWLFDCGEGTQNQILRAGLRFHLLDSIFITHAHGDHIFGLPGLLNTMSLQSRRPPLDVYGPREIGMFLSSSLEYSSVDLPFALRFHEAAPGHLALPESDHRFHEQARIECALLEHRVITFGYAMELEAGAETLKLAYCTDTRPCDNAIALASGADVLVHEATYANDLIEKAYERGHSTAYQVGLLAQKAHVSLLVLTHFSPRYNDIEPLLREARDAFPRTVAAQELQPIALATKGLAQRAGAQLFPSPPSLEQ